MLEPFDLRLVVDRLATCKSDAGYHLVDYAADQANAIAQRNFAMPAAFVLEPAYTAISLEQSASGAFVNVPHEYEIGILSVVQNYQAASGRSQSADARELRKLLWQAMLGWSPEQSGFVFDLARGEFVSMDDSCFFYLDVFSFRRIVRNV